MPSDHQESLRELPEIPDDARRVGANGRRLGLNQLNLGAAGDRSQQQGRWSRFVVGLRQFLAGMYTGESCAGTPRDDHCQESAPDGKHTK